ncbi:amidase signature domain-containing protein [Dactylonectria macrodidyma]|uniref:Amidase signature domain-containing protein n=1 Tax=Dactylonectria macrodidyma TaxID=307937 RepID=A0A9P9EAY1_9HYPO|nr:amidase signature domain-containing protein [Dactylonectria macrodidyma]
MPGTDWQALIHEKRALRDSQIPTEWRLDDGITSQARRDNPISGFDLLDQTNLLTKREREITDKYDATALLGQLASGVVSSLEVTTAFCKRAAIAQQLINPLTEIFFDNALERAKELDAYLAREGKPVGPFHGLPISLKDMWMVKGEAATLGFVAYLSKPVAEENSPLVDVLLEGGAVFYCKTNHDTSSGLGEDFAHRHTLVDGRREQRVRRHAEPTQAYPGSFRQQHWRGRLGWLPGLSPRCRHRHWRLYSIPFSRQWLLRIQANVEPDPLLWPADSWRRDATALAIPWVDVPKRKLRIGYWEGSPQTPVFPPIVRALREAAEALKAAGHEIVPISTPEAGGTLDCAGIYIHSLGFDTKATLMQFLDDAEEDILPAMQQMKAVMAEIPKSTLEDVWKFHTDRGDYRHAWHSKWANTGIDVLLCPAHQGTGMPHSTYGLPVYTMIWNLLDCPASVIPFLKANKRIDVEEVEGYDPDALDGAPAHVQVVGWTFRDEEVLMATEVIDEVLQKQPGAHL